MPPRTSYISVTDQFCGAGGSSLGAVAAGAEVVLAMNHWDLAIETHNTNFPQTDHVLADISQVDPRRYPTTDVLITSPECTNHSLAKGQKRKNHGQLPLFKEDMKYDPAAERSRATMWDVPRFAEFHNYNVVIVENVIDARYWRLWDAWIHAMLCLDYDFEIVYLNSMFCHPTPQSRDRMYVVFWKKGNRAPDLRFTPRAYCPQCAADVDSVQTWKKDFPWGRYRRQYVYRCPQCLEEVTPYYYAAFNAIDWSDLGTRIGDRKRPLKERTLQRIQYGLDKFGRQVMVTQIDYSHSDSPRTKPATEPLSTQSTAQTFAMIAPPFLTSVNYFSDRPRDVSEPLPTQTTAGKLGITVPPFMVNHGGWVPSSAKELTEPLPTQVTSRAPGLVFPPFIMGYYTRRDTVSSVDDPLPTQSTQPRHYLVTPQPYIVELRNNSTARSIEEALATITAGGGHHGLVTPFLTSYYGSSKQNTPVDQPIHTIPTVARHALVIPEGELRIEDCYFRMLKPPEIGLGMAFPDDYVVLGTQREQVKQYGNACTPPALELLIERCAAALH